MNMNEKGIYIITNIVNKKIYIGQVGQGKNTTFNTRYKSHWGELKKNKHYNEHLQNSWNKYKEESFTFKIIEICDEKLLNEREIYWIDFYKACDSKNGYNKSHGGAIKLGEESKLKLSRTKTGVKFSESHKQNMRKPKSLEHARHISEGLKGIPISEEHKQKISIANKGNIPWMKGKTHSQESLQKMSNALKGKDTWMKGKRHSEESLKKISENNGRCWLGKKLPQEMKDKMSKSSMGERNPMFGKKPWNYIEITQDMIDYYNENNMTRKIFLKKYKVRAIWDRIRKDKI